MRFCAFDVEGRVGGSGVIGVAIYSDIYQGYLTEIPQALDVLKDHAALEYTLVAHNAEYDIQTLLWQYGEPVRMVYYNGRWNRGEWRYQPKRKLCHIWDTLRLSNGLSLADLGKALGHPKLATPQLLLGRSPDRYAWICDRHQVGECVECYAVRDAEIAYRYILSYQEFMGTYGASPKRTIGSAAIELWRTFDQPEPCYLPNKASDQFCRRGYFGGRTEVFQYGVVAPLWCADVKSMYPACMLETPMPDPRTLNYSDRDNLGPHLLDAEGMTEATVYVPAMHVPPLPVARNGKLYFPVGVFRGIWCNLELRAAIERGVQVRTIHAAAWTPDSLYPFSNYILTLMSARDHFLSTKDPRERVVKVIMNALYGRLGLGKGQHEHRAELFPPDASGTLLRGKDTYTIGNKHFIVSDYDREIFTPWANVLWAATITAAARVRLLSLLEMQGEAVVYCDTDSIFSSAQINGLASGLGALQGLEEWGEGRFLAPKMYLLTDPIRGTKARSKGISARVAERYLRTGTASWEIPLTTKAAMIRRKMPGEWVPITKEWKHAPAKRHIISPDWIDGDMGTSATTPVSFDIGSTD